MTTRPVKETMNIEDISGFVPGMQVNLTPDNDELGAIMFGACWPQVKERLAEPGPAYTVRVTSVTPLPAGSHRVQVALEPVENRAERRARDARARRRR